MRVNSIQQSGLSTLRKQRHVTAQLLQQQLHGVWETIMVLTRSDRPYLRLKEYKENNPDDKFRILSVYMANYK